MFAVTVTITNFLLFSMTAGNFAATFVVVIEKSLMIILAIDNPLSDKLAEKQKLFDNCSRSVCQLLPCG